MNARAELLQWKRQQLLAESAALRTELAAHTHSLATTLDSVQIGLNIVNRVRKHPGWIVALVLGLVVITPRRLSSFLRLGTLGMRTWRFVAPVLQLLAPPK